MMSDTPHDAIEVQATFRFVGDRVVPEEITKEVGLTPTHSHKKGEEVVGKGRCYPTGYWGVDSRLKSGSMEEHLESLLDILTPKSTEIRSVSGKLGLTPTFYCGYFHGIDSGGSISLSAQTLEKLGNLKAGITINIYSD